MEKQLIPVKEAQKVLEIISSLDERKMDLAISVLTGIKLAVEVDRQLKEKEKVS